MITLKSIFHLQILLLLADVVFGDYFYNWQRQSAQDPVYKPVGRTGTQQRMLYDYYPTYYQMSPEDYYYYYYYYNYKPESLFGGYPATSYDYFAPYYQDIPVVPATPTTSENKYRYYDLYNDPERLIRDYQIQQREMSQPIGHEVKYESSDNDNENNDNDDGIVLDEANAAFLKNLMMQQMYEESVLERQRLASSPNYYDQDYRANMANDRPPIGGSEDEEVQELKELSKKPRQRKNRQRKQRRPAEVSSPAKKKKSWFQGEDAPAYGYDDVVVYTDRKPVVKPTEGPKREARGQKEEVLMRPATPVRRPFSDSVLEMMNQQERKRSPSVYDTIRHMLDMEKKHDEKPPENQKDNLKSSMRKRIVSSEDSLTRQLSILKKSD